MYEILTKKRFDLLDLMILAMTVTSAAVAIWTLT
jgi:hypothetical protein